jgi:hypothetical protein
VESASFTIEFPEHLPRAKWQYCLNQLSDTGASIEETGDRLFRVVCSKPKQLAHVGWTLFHTHFRDLCRVVAVSGGAEAQASAYPKPPNS